MAVDLSKQGSKGGDQQYDSSQLRGVREERGIVTGFVKANVHGSNMGVIQVWIPSFSTNPKDKSQWRTVRYCSPYYSRVNSQGPNDDFLSTKVSSGIITPPPDLGTKVLCFFPEGRNAEGYYFAGVPDTFMMQSVPEATLNREGRPGGEFNDDESGNKPAKKVANYKRERRAVDFYTEGYTISQGLDRDSVRGIGNSSYMRESPSELIGIVSKGRRVADDGSDFTIKYNQALKDKDTKNTKILDGLLGPYARRKGHSITLDDGDIDGNSNQIRFRTSTGHQILLNDTQGVIYIGNANGTTWIELNNNGTVDVYAKDSINFRSKNLNFHADQNIKFHSKGYTQLVSEQQMHVEGKEQLVMTSEGEAGITGTGLHLNSGGSLFATAKSQAFINAGGVMSVAGALVLLQGPKTPAKTAVPVNALTKDDVSFDREAGQYATSDLPLQTTVDRAVTHEPFVGHGAPNQASAYTGGLQGGGGGLGGAFGVIAPIAGPLGAVAGGAGGFGAVAGALGASGGLAGGLGAALGGGVLPGGLASNVLGSLGSTGALSTFTGTLGGSAGDFFGTAFGGGLGDIAGNFGADFLTPGNLLPGGLQDSVLGSLGNGIGLENFASAIPGGLGDITGNLNLENITGSLGDITSSLPIGDIQDAFGSAAGQLQGADFGKLVSDASGKITSITGELGANLPALGEQFASVTQKIVPQLNDALPELLENPVLKKFPVTDIVQQLDTGFSVGVLDNLDMQGLNAAVVQQVGSLNNNAFVDSVTKSVGKYGFNVDQLKAQGLVRPEAIFNDQLADPSVWTGKGGAHSLSKFLGNGGLQEQVMQQVVAGDYQKMLNEGAIKITDGPKEVMGMLTAANISTTDIAKAVREGTSSIEGMLKNTTNIPDGVDIASKVKDAISTGAAAGTKTQQVKAEKTSKTTGAYGEGIASQAQAAKPTKKNAKVLDSQISNIRSTLDTASAQLTPQQRRALQTQLDVAAAVKDKQEGQTNVTVTTVPSQTTVTRVDPTPTTTTTVDEDGTVRTVTTSGGGSTTTTGGGYTGTTRTSTVYDPYGGPNGARLKQLDAQIDALDLQRFDAMLDKAPKETRDRLNKEYRALLAERNKLGY